MSIFSSFFGRSNRGRWHRVDHPSPTIGPLELLADGTFAFGPLRFAQDCSFRDTKICEAMVNKKPGEGEVLAIDTPHGDHLRLKFESNAWWYFG